MAKYYKAVGKLLSPESSISLVLQKLDETVLLDDVEAPFGLPQNRPTTARQDHPTPCS